MNISEKFNDPELSKEDEEAILGAFVRRQKREALGKRWSKKLATDHDVKRTYTPGAAKEKPRLRRLVIWAASTAATLLLILMLVLPQLGGDSRSEVVAELISNVEIRTLRGEATDDYAELRGTFARQFNAQEFAAAITTGKQLVADSSAQPQDALNLGLAYLSSGQVPEATGIFQRLLDNEPSLRTEARFYLALARFKAGNEAAALKLLDDVDESVDGAAWYRKAQRVLSAS